MSDLCIFIICVTSLSCEDKGYCCAVVIWAPSNAVIASFLSNFAFGSGFSSIRFSTVLIDEATQATEAAALVPIVRGCQQLILVGDQNQVWP